MSDNKNMNISSLPRKHNKSLVPFAKNLRKNMTKEERHLWYDFLRKYPVKFTRQMVLGEYIADFYSAQAQIVIELDGSQHYTSDAKEYDLIRTEFLEQYGIQVVRINNMEIVRNFDGVCRYIDKILYFVMEKHAGVSLIPKNKVKPFY